MEVIEGSTNMFCPAKDFGSSATNLLRLVTSAANPQKYSQTYVPPHDKHSFSDTNTCVHILITHVRGKP